MSVNKSNFKRLLTDYLYIALASFILAFAVNFFLVPSKISTGGISGLGTVLYYTLGIPVSVTTLLANAVLFVFGYRMLKRSSVVKTVFGILFLTVFLEVTTLFGSFGEDKLISAVFGGTLAGLGVGMCVSRDASTGGSDFAALMINKLFPHISVAGVIFIIDAVIILVSGIAFRDYTVMFYSVIALYIANKVTDFMLVRGDFAKAVYIITKKSDEIAKRIMSEMERGVTGIYGKGYYKGMDTTVLLCIVRSREVSRLVGIAKTEDKAAFTIVSDVKKVLGEGFMEE